MKKSPVNDIYYAVAHKPQDELDAQKLRYENFETSYIPKIFKDVLSLEVKDWKQATSYGTSHIIFFVRFKNSEKELILRTNTGFSDIPEAVMQVEKLVTDQVAALGVPTNRILHVDISRKTYPFDFQIQEVLEGKDLEDNYAGSKEAYDKMSFAIGTYVATYQQLTYPLFGLFDKNAVAKNQLQGTKKTFYEYVTVKLDSDLEYLVKADVISRNAAKQIAKLFEEHKPIINIKQGSLLHHDLADHNIMFKNNRITGLFDWENCCVGDPILDIASCPTWKSHYPREEKLIESYRSVVDLPEHFQEKKDIYLLRTMLWKMVFAIRSGILNDARKQRFYTTLERFKLA